MKTLATVIAAYVVLTTLPVVAQGGPPCAPAQGTVSVSETVGVTWIDCSLSSTSVTLQCSPSACRVTLVRVSGVTVTVNLIGSPVDNTWRNISITVVDSVFTNTMGIGSVDGTGLATPPTLVNFFIGMYNVSSTSSGTSTSTVPIGSAIECGDVRNAFVSISNCTFVAKPSNNLAIPLAVGYFVSTQASTATLTFTNVTFLVANITLNAPSNGKAVGITTVRPLVVSNVHMTMSTSFILLTGPPTSRVSVMAVLMVDTQTAPQLMSVENVTILGESLSITLSAGGCLLSTIAAYGGTSDGGNGNQNVVLVIRNVSLRMIGRDTLVSLSASSRDSGVTSVVAGADGSLSLNATDVDCVAEGTYTRSASNGNPTYAVSGVAVHSTSAPTVTQLYLARMRLVVANVTLSMTSVSSVVATAIAGVAVAAQSARVSIVGAVFELSSCRGTMLMGTAANAVAGVAVWSLAQSDATTAVDMLVSDATMTMSRVSQLQWTVPTGNVALAGVAIYNFYGVGAISVNVSVVAILVNNVSSALTSTAGCASFAGLSIFNNCNSVVSVCAMPVRVWVKGITIHGSDIIHTTTASTHFNVLVGVTTGWWSSTSTSIPAGRLETTLTDTELRCTNCQLTYQSTAASHGIALVGISAVAQCPAVLYVTKVTALAAASLLSSTGTRSIVATGALLVSGGNGTFVVNESLFHAANHTTVEVTSGDSSQWLTVVAGVNAALATAASYLTAVVRNSTGLRIESASTVTVHCASGSVAIASISVIATSGVTPLGFSLSVADADIAVLDSSVTATLTLGQGPATAVAVSSASATRVAMCVCNSSLSVTTGNVASLSSTAVSALQLGGQVRFSVLNSSLTSPQLFQLLPVANVDWIAVPLNGTSYLINVRVGTGSKISYASSSTGDAMPVVASGVYDGTTAQSNLNVLFPGAIAGNLNATTVPDADLLSLLNSTSVTGLSCGRWYDEYWMPQQLGTDAPRRRKRTLSVTIARRVRTATRVLAISTMPSTTSPTTLQQFTALTTSTPATTHRRDVTRTLMHPFTQLPNVMPNTTTAPTPRNKHRTRTSTQRYQRTAVPSTSAASSTAADVITHAGIDATAAQSITVTAYGSAVIASALSPTVATKASAASRLVGSAVCEVFGGGNDLPTPDYTQVVPCPMVGDLATDVQSGAAVLVTSAVCLLSLLATKCAERWNASHPKAEVERWSVSFSNACVGICLCYWVPNAMSMAVLVLVHGGGAARAMGAVGLVVLAAYVVALVKVCLPRPSASGAATEGASFFGDVLDAFFMGARDVSRPLIRMYTFEDVGVAIAIAMLSGVSPSTVGGCTAVGAAMLLVTMLHCGYLCVVRPAEDRLELALSLVNGFLLLGLALATIAALINGSIFMPVLAYVLLATNAAFFVQTVVLAASALVRYLRISGSESQPQLKPSAADGGGAVLLLMPLTNPIHSTADHHQAPPTPWSLDDHATMTNPLLDDKMVA